MNRRVHIVSRSAANPLPLDDLADSLPHFGSRIQRAIEEGIHLLALADERRARRGDAVL